MDQNLASLAGCTTDTIAHMLVGIANGNKTVSTGICPNLVWTMQGRSFSHSIRLLRLGGCDMVLGADWLKTLGNILFNFDRLTMSFKWKGGTITLQGTTNTTSVSMLTGKALMNFFWKNTHGIIGSLCAITAVPISDPIPEPIQCLLKDFQDVFQEPTTLPPPRALDHAIPLKPDAQPTNQRPYRYPYIQKSVLEQMVKEVLTMGLIQPSHSPFASPVILVKKKDGSWRFCVDYRQLNHITIKDKFHMPIIDELLDE